MHGFVSKPEIQKLNRNSIYVFVNGRLIRDRLIQHAIIEAYRNILPPTVFPVVLLFLDLPSGEVDVNVHPSKTEVRFRQQSVMHDFVRDSVRAALMKARPVPQFAVEISAHPTASPSLAGTRNDSPDAAGGRSLLRLRPGRSLSACRRRCHRRSAGAFSSEKAFRSRATPLCPWCAPPNPRSTRWATTLALRQSLTKRKRRAIWPRRWPRSNRWARFANPSSWR